MKKLQYIVLAVLLLGLASCGKEWMNTVPEGAVKTADQKADAEQKNADAAQANVNAIYAQMIALYGGLGDMGYSRHNDYGFAAVCELVETNGQDFTGFNIGYNWFSNSLYPNNRENSLTTAAGLIPHLIWNTYYKIINACNKVIGGIDPLEPGSQETNLCQAYTVRAFCYLQLAQLFQAPYSEATKALPCVPLVVDNMPAERQSNNPRASVEAVYALIYSDLNYACASEAFAEYARADKGSVDQSVAFGVRARANLISGQKAAAAADAQQCLDLSKATPLSIEECGVPGFCDAAAHNVIWANIIVETNDIVKTGIVNWPSHLSSFYQDGYVGVGAYHGIAEATYNQIPETDVRKGWWLNKDLESPLLDAPGYVEAKEALQKKAEYNYITTKFGTGDGTIGGDAAAAADWIVMRAEEMYLIIAEANEDAAALENFVQTYRDPSYKAEGNIVDAVWFQRRIELWGEGFGFQDILRLHKPIIRTTSSNWPAAWQQNIMADDPCLLWRIPQAEIEANQGISEADNNPYANPTPFVQ